MKRRITLSIALALSVVLVSLVSSDQAVNAQPGGLRRVADTGIVTLGLNQKLRISSVIVGDVTGNAAITFRKIGYTQETCIGGVCKLTASSQTTSAPITLMSGEGAFFDIFVGDLDAVRGVVLSNNRKVRVKAMIINTTTGEVDAFFDIFTDLVDG